VPTSRYSERTLLLLLAAVLVLCTIPRKPSRACCKCGRSSSRCTDRPTPTSPSSSGPRLSSDTRSSPSATRSTGRLLACRLRPLRSLVTSCATSSTRTRPALAPTRCLCNACSTATPDHDGVLLCRFYRSIARIDMILS